MGGDEGEGEGNETGALGGSVLPAPHLYPNDHEAITASVNISIFHMANHLSNFCRHLHP